MRAVTLTEAATVTVHGKKTVYEPGDHAVDDMTAVALRSAHALVDGKRTKIAKRVGKTAEAELVAEATEEAAPKRGKGK